MAVTVNIKVSGAEMVKVRQDNGDFITINPDEDRSYIMTDAPGGGTTFYLNRVPLDGTLSLFETPIPEPKPTPAPIAAVGHTKQSESVKPALAPAKPSGSSTHRK